MLGLQILAEALARLEHKVDLALNRLTFLDKTPYAQLQFEGSNCPVCSQLITYQVDITHNLVTRKCGCKTGKLPPLIPLVPVPGATDAVANPSADSSSAARRKLSKHGDRGEEG